VRCEVGHRLSRVAVLRGAGNAAPAGMAGPGPLILPERPPPAGAPRAPPGR
jgi:hypothetical protein